MCVVSACVADLAVVRYGQEYLLTKADPQENSALQTGSPSWLNGFWRITATFWCTSSHPNRASITAWNVSGAAPKRSRFPLSEDLPLLHWQTQGSPRQRHRRGFSWPRRPLLSCRDARNPPGPRGFLEQTPQCAE